MGVVARSRALDARRLPRIRMLLRRMRLPGLLTSPRFGVAVLVVAQAGWLFAATAGSDFWLDDLLRLSEQRYRYSGSPSDLVQPVFGHLAPGLRLQNTIVEWLFPASYGVTRVFTIGICCLTTYAVWRVLCLLVGERWAAVLVLIPVALSPLLISSALWWTAAQHQLWSALWTVFSIEAVLRWHRSRRRGALVLAVGLWLMALSTYEKPLLMPLVLLAIFVSLAPAGARATMRFVASLWPAGAVLGAVGALYCLVYRAGGYGSVAVPAEPRQLVGGVQVAWWRGFWPSWAGAGAPVAGVVSTGWQRWAPQLLLALAVGVTLLQRRRAWRAWTVLVVVFAVEAYVVAVGRGGVFGPAALKNTTYLVDMLPLITILLGLAVFGPAAVHPGAQRKAPAWQLSQRGRRLAPVAVLGVALIYGINVWPAVDEIRRTWPGLRSAKAVHNVRAVQSAKGQSQAIFFDAVFPDTHNLEPSWRRLSGVFGLGYGPVAVEGRTEPQYIVLPDGNVTRGRLDHPSAVKGRHCTTSADEPLRLVLDHRAPAMDGEYFADIAVTASAVTSYTIQALDPDRNLIEVTDLSMRKAVLPAGPYRISRPLGHEAVSVVVVTAGAPICVTEVKVGLPVADG
jgi:hypothetical protein